MPSNLCYESDVSVSSDNLRCKYPEFDDSFTWPDDVVDKFLGWAAAELEASVWDCHFEAGSLALAAHMMAVVKKSLSAQGNAMGAAPGGISSLKTDMEQISYAAPAVAPSSADSSLATTIYGLEFMRLRERVVDGPLYVC